MEPGDAWGAGWAGKGSPRSQSPSLSPPSPWPMPVLGHLPVSPIVSPPCTPPFVGKRLLGIRAGHTHSTGGWALNSGSARGRGERKVWAGRLSWG